MAQRSATSRGQLGHHVGVTEERPDRRYACPCCHYLTILDAWSTPPGTFYICPVCGWEDDNVQYANPDLRGGANIDNLNECRAAFKKWREADIPADLWRRPPLPDEMP